jgi:AsmA protein
MNAVDVDSLMTALMPPSEEKSDTKISGKINATIKSQTSGNSIAEFSESLQADIVMETQALQLSPLNMEQHFCELAGQLSKDTETLEEGEVSEEVKQWPEFTKLRDLKGKMTIKQERLNIESISAGLENLQIATTGYIDLKSNQYNLRLPMTLKGENSSADGCRIKNEFVRNRELSILQCEGPLDKLDAKSDCGLDKKAMGELFKQYAKYKCMKNLDSKKDRLLEKANEKFGDGAGELLKGLFGR